MAGIRVLHVDDDPSFADLAAAFLEREDDRIDVVTETNAADAIDLIESGDAAIDCVVSDYDMPGTDGLGFLEAVRREREELPFVLFTGKGSEEIAVEAIDAGATDYLRKGGAEQYAVLANRIVDAVEGYRTARRAERTERRLRDLAEKSTDVLWMYTGDWEELVFINSAFEDLFGLPVETLRANPRRFLEAVHPDDRARVERAMERLSEGRSADLEYRVNEAEEYGRWVRVEAEPILDEDGTVDRIVGFARDVTEREEYERSLAALNEVAVDLDARETVEGVCERCIEASREILRFDLSVIDIEEDGYLHKAAISRDVPAANATTMSVEEGVAGKTYRTGESLLIRDLADHPEAKPQGPYRSAVSIPIGTHGVFQAVAEEPDAFDETDLELAELLVRHAASALDRLERERQLRRQNERLEEFTRIVSHDLRNPLLVLDGHLELAREDCECDSEHLAEAAAVLSRMDSIVEDTLTLASEGRLVDELEPVALEQIVRNCWRNVATESAALEVATDGTIRADPGRLHHVFENLFRNAVEHGTRQASDRSALGDAVEHGSTSPGSQAQEDASGQTSCEPSVANAPEDVPEHGTTNGRTPTDALERDSANLDVTVRVGETPDGFYVEDDGEGIPEDRREDVLEPGYTENDGSGFGLAIVRQVAEAHGWELRVTDGTDGGARFEFSGVDGPNGARSEREIEIENENGNETGTGIR